MSGQSSQKHGVLKMNTAPTPLFESLVAQYRPSDQWEQAHKQQVLQFLSETKNPYSRSNLLGHIVADAWIVNSRRDRVVLVEHGQSGFWTNPGGHCDGNSDVHREAIREAAEETGLENLEPLLGGNIFDIALSQIPNRERYGKLEPAHFHLDICFAFEGSEETPLVCSDESTAVRWVSLVDIEKLKFSPAHKRRPKKTLPLLR